MGLFNISRIAVPHKYLYLKEYLRYFHNISVVNAQLSCDDHTIYMYISYRYVQNSLNDKAILEIYGTPLIHVVIML